MRKSTEECKLLTDLLQCSLPSPIHPSLKFHDKYTSTHIKHELNETAVISVHKLKLVTYICTSQVKSEVNFKKLNNETTQHNLPIKHTESNLLYTS